MVARRSAVPLLLPLFFAGSAGAQAVDPADRSGPYARAGPVPTASWDWASAAPAPARRGNLVYRSDSASIDRPRYQVPPPGWRRLQRTLGFIGGLVVGFSLNTLLYNSVSENPGLLIAAGVGAGAVVVPALPWPSHPDAAVMQEVAASGPDYGRAFMEGYSSQLHLRRFRASFKSRLLGVLSGFLGIELLCRIGNCDQVIAWGYGTGNDPGRAPRSRSRSAKTLGSPAKAYGP